MIAYQMLGTNDLSRAKAFYDEVLGLFKLAKAVETERAAFYMFEGGTRLAVVKPYDGAPATVGNGSMTALACDSAEMVRAVYEKALQLGGTDEGEPGDRMGMGYFAYFRDPDGNKLCAACINF